MSLPSADGTDQSMAQRYGVSSTYRRITTAVLLGLVVAAFLGWVVWAALNHASADAGARVRSYNVVSAHKVTVRLDVHRPQNEAVVCTLTARAEDHTVVGEQIVRVPPGEEGDLTVTTAITTDREATTAVVSGCS